MTKKIMGAVLIILLLAGGAALYKFLLPSITDSHLRSTSDAQNLHGDIRLALDNWVGYFPFRSAEMKSRMRQSGWRLVVEDDQADYAARMKKLNDGDLDFAVVTVDSYLLNAAKYNYPGTIILVIDESKGGDAIIARKDKVDSIDKMKGSSGLRVAFTPDSPSHHLAKAAADHFAVPEILPAAGSANRIETMGSEEAVEKLVDGKVDVAIAWEPDVSKALGKKGIVKILGTEDTEKLIVDILVVNREFAKDQPEAVDLMLNTYFRVLKYYRDNHKALVKDIKDETDLSGKTVETMLKGVHWVSLSENCEQWFGIAAMGGHSLDGLAATIESTVKILINSGDFSGNPLPNGDPYRMLSSRTLEHMYRQGMTGFTTPSAANGPVPNSLEAPFVFLSQSRWDDLKEVATLKVDPIIFQSGSSELDFMAKQVVDDAVERLKHYPNFRVAVKGHTSDIGDSNANKQLSQERADSVVRYMKVAYNIDPNRLRAAGYGGDAPLNRQPGESMRAWRYRLPRVELVLVREDF